MTGNGHPMIASTPAIALAIPSTTTPERDPVLGSTSKSEMRTPRRL
jgi:hypothetical protein